MENKYRFFQQVNLKLISFWKVTNIFWRFENPKKQNLVETSFFLRASLRKLENIFLKVFTNKYKNEKRTDIFCKLKDEILLLRGN